MTSAFCSDMIWNAMLIDLIFCSISSVVEAFCYTMFRNYPYLLYFYLIFRMHSIKFSLIFNTKFNYYKINPNMASQLFLISALKPQTYLFFIRDVGKGKFQYKKRLEQNIYYNPQDSKFCKEMANKFDRLRESISIQLSSGRFKKAQLAQAYNSLNDNEIACKKMELADILGALIVEHVEHQYHLLLSTGLNDEQICNQLIKRLDQKLDAMNLRGLSFSKKIQDIFNFESHPNSNYMANNRQTRVNQQVIQNIWNSNTKQIQCLCPKAPSNLQQNKKIENCYKCGFDYHSECFWPPEKGQLFQCPFCYLKFCMPHKQVKQILFGGYLPILKKQKVQYKINFNLDVKTKVERSLYLQARCVKFNNKNRYEISWPDNASFSIGKNRICQFKPLPTNSPLKRRADEPIKIDKSRLQFENEIIIEQKNTCENGYKLNKKCNHLIVIMIVSDLTSQNVLMKLQKSLLPIKQSKRFLTNQMSHETGDILIQKIAISLRCQYFGGRMKLPARSRLCMTHYQPFDLMNFINSSIHARSSTRKWKCPICDKRAYDLVIDKYILDLMIENPTANQIIFKQNGQPEMIQEKEDDNENQIANQKMGNFNWKNDNDKKNQQVIEIDIDQEQQQDKQNKKTSNCPIQNNNIKSKQQVNVNSNCQQLVIELEEQKQKQKQQQKQREKGLEKQILEKKKKLGNEDRVANTSRYHEGQQTTLKKVRILNDGSIQMADKQKKNDNKNSNILVVNLQSSEDQIPPPVDKSQLLGKKVQQNTKNKISEQSQLSEKQKAKPKQAQPANLHKVSSLNAAYHKPRPKLPEDQTRQLAVIDIESDEEEQKKTRSPQDLDRHYYKQVQNIRREMDQHGKSQITEQDTEIFQDVFGKILSMVDKG